MDKELQDIIALASQRGHGYVKGEITGTEFPEKLAELGVFLLEKAKAIQNGNGEAIRDEIIDLQNKIDDMRKLLFSKKIRSS